MLRRHHRSPVCTAKRTSRALVSACALRPAAACVLRNTLGHTAARAASVRLHAFHTFLFGFRLTVFVFVVVCQIITITRPACIAMRQQHATATASAHHWAHAAATWASAAAHARRVHRAIMGHCAPIAKRRKRAQATARATLCSVAAAVLRTTAVQRAISAVSVVTAIRSAKAARLTQRIARVRLNSQAQRAICARLSTMAHRPTACFALLKRRALDTARVEARAAAFAMLVGLTRVQHQRQQPLRTALAAHRATQVQTVKHSTSPYHLCTGQPTAASL